MIVKNQLQWLYGQGIRTSFEGFKVKVQKAVSNALKKNLLEKLKLIRILPTIVWLQCQYEVYYF